MADGHPIITRQLFGGFWCGHRESSAVPAQQDRRLILPFLPLKLQVIYCTRGYREDVYNREWNQSSHQLQLWSRAVHLGDLKKENSSSTLLDCVTWLLTPWKKTSSKSVLCLSVSVPWPEYPSTSFSVGQELGYLGTLPFHFCSSPYKEELPNSPVLVLCSVSALTPSGLLFLASLWLKQMILIIYPLVTQRSNSTLKILSH